jgi:predicted alpha/beta-hydrolase family hydrolase
VVSVLPELVTIAVDQATRVSGLMQRPPQPRACLVLAHGAGAGMQHPFMSDVADDLAGLGIATLRYQFPYMEKHGKRPDPPALCHATVRAAVATAHQLEPDLPLFAGGKSFGGRMTSQAQAERPLGAVRGLAFLGFPLHAPKEPSDTRAEHLSRVHIPMLFLQGTRDAFAELALIHKLIERLGQSATLKLLEDADHSFHVAARTGRTDSEVRIEMLNALSTWLESMSRNT